MDPSHFCYPYSTIAYASGLTPNIYDKLPSLKAEDLLYYVALFMEKTNVVYTGDPIDYISSCIIKDRSLIFLFGTSKQELVHTRAINQAYDKNLTYEPLTGKYVEYQLTFSSLVFPIGSICRHSYECVYFMETGFEARNDYKLDELLRTKEGDWIDLDTLELSSSKRSNRVFVSDKYKLCSNSRIKFESVLMIIPKYLIKQNPKKKLTRKALPKKLRLDLWELYFPNMRKGTCFTCGLEIDINAFEAGHIKSVANGGPDFIDNLLPICGPCNRSMSSNDMYEWAARYYPNAPLFSIVIRPYISKPIDKIYSINMLGWIYDHLIKYKLSLDDIFGTYISTFFFKDKGVVNNEKVKTKFMYWFNSTSSPIIGPDGLSYKIIITKETVNNFRIPENLVPNDEWNKIKKPSQTDSKSLYLTWIYDKDFDSLKFERDNSMWGYINDEKFLFQNNGKCGAGVFTKQYNTWISSFTKGSQISQTISSSIKYSPTEIVKVIGLSRGWNVYYEDRTFIGLSKL